MVIGGVWEKYMVMVWVLVLVGDMKLLCCVRFEYEFEVKDCDCLMVDCFVLL